MPAWLRVREDGVSVALLVQPNAKKSEIVGPQGDHLKVKVAAPAVEGAANAALVAFLASCLGLRRRDISLLKGATGRNKILEIKGLSPDLVLQRLQGGGSD